MAIIIIFACRDEKPWFIPRAQVWASQHHYKYSYQRSIISKLRRQTIYILKIIQRNFVCAKGLTDVLMTSLDYKLGCDPPVLIIVLVCLRNERPTLTEVRHSQQFVSAVKSLQNHIETRPVLETQRVDCCDKAGLLRKHTHTHTDPFSTQVTVYSLTCCVGRLCVYCSALS